MAGRWEFAVTVDRGSALPLFLQVARTVADDICRGRLKPGDRLPGTRTLAESLGVNRVTVLTAYDELMAEGWLQLKPARGTFVAHDLPDPARRSSRTTPSGQMRVAAYSMPPAPKRMSSVAAMEGVLALAGSLPDTRLVDVEPLAAAYRRVLRRDGASLLRYGRPGGEPGLRTALAEMLSATRGLAVTASEIVVTSGSQMALSIVAKTLLRPGSVVAVESPGYPHAWEAFRQAGATPVPVAVDAGGINVTALESLFARRKIAALYVTPHHQFPTTVTLAASRRLRLLELARVHRAAVIEDDYDHEFRYEGRPVLPLASLDRDGVTVYVGTLSKVVAPGLRIGYIAAPRDVVERASTYRHYLDIHGHHVEEAAVAELIARRDVQRHVNRVRRVYRARRDLLCSLLSKHLGGALSWEVPAGGVALWVKAAPDINVERWAARAPKFGVAFAPGSEYFLSPKPSPFARLGFACLDETELKTAVKRLALSRPKSG